MFIALLFVAGAGLTYTAVRSLSPLVIPLIAGAVVFTYLMLGLAAVNNATGISQFLDNSWHDLSGVDNPSQVIGGCYGSGFVKLILFVVLTVLVIINLIVGIGAFIGIPLGIAGSLVGAVSSIATQGRKLFVMGLATLTTGLACTVIAGLDMRFMHFLSTLSC